MKFVSLTIVIMTTSLSTLSSQEIVQTHKPYRVWISQFNQPLSAQGILYQLNDSSILASNPWTVKDYTTEDLEIEEINISGIETIKLRRKNRVGRGAWIGAVSGFVVGGLIGLISGDDPPCPRGAWFCLRSTAEEKAISAGTGLAIVGTAVGSAIGAIKVKIPINGNQYRYTYNQDKLRKYSIVK
ncbi:MAG: hypothetical protein AAGC88_09925 [Bacteroidota bacterium]